IFFGDYPRTPFGFHIDPHQEAVFQYVVRGRRRACFWDGLSMDEDDAQWIEDSNGLTTPPHEPDLAFDLEPGDLVFWPGTFVHGMEPEGPSMGVSMVIDRASPRRRDQVVSSLETITSGGQSALPPMTEVEMLVPGTRYRRRGVFPAAYERLGEVLIIGVGGRTFDWPDPASAAATMQLIDVLNAQDEIDVDQVLARCSGGALSHDMACEVLVLFEGLGYFVREPG
nr:cupin domain-containing protein [Deltaproteobacteria bacterium]